MFATMPQTEEHRVALSHPPQTVVAQLKRVSKTFGDVQALHNLDFSVRAGELLALLGPNGAGKTTAVKLFLGLEQSMCWAETPFIPKSARALGPCCKSPRSRKH
jgi:ATPase subunit of ABC transporter with duplicated ATPase domains